VAGDPRQIAAAARPRAAHHADPDRGAGRPGQEARDEGALEAEHVEERYETQRDRGQDVQEQPDPDRAKLERIAERIVLSAHARSG
jgi:hypothetical protein